MGEAEWRALLRLKMQPHHADEVACARQAINHYKKRVDEGAPADFSTEMEKAAIALVAVVDGAAGETVDPAADMCVDASARAPECHRELS